jgi:DNA-binding GntR family transcriptional regulator
MVTHAIDKSSLKQKVAEKIKQAILDLSYKPGHKLVVDELAAEYCVSKTPVREGLLELIPDGLVVYDGNSYSVPEYTPRDIREIFSIRRALESFSVERAIKFMTGEIFHKLEKLHRDESAIEETKAWDEIFALDFQFHGLIAEVSNNLLLASMLEKLKDQYILIIRSLYTTNSIEASDGHEASRIDEHGDILSALRDRSPERAAEAMRTHLSQSEVRALKWFYRYKSPVPQTCRPPGSKSALEYKSLSDRVAEQIKNQILDASLKPGQRLIVEKLATDLDVSRTPVREGLRKLASENLITYDRNQYRVRELTPRYIEEVFAVRRALEALAAAVAAKYISDAQLYRMREIIDRVKGMMIKTPEEYSKLYSIDIDFHETIAEAACNQRLKRMLDILRDQILFIRRWVLVPRMMDDTRQTTVEEHEAVWEKLCQGDSDGASQQMAKHLERGERRTLERIRK